jgi:hypothetical protein
MFKLDSYTLSSVDGNRMKITLAHDVSRLRLTQISNR